MSTEITRLELGGRRRVILGYGVGMALYVVFIVALYPQFEHTTGLNDLAKNLPTLASLIGISGAITSPAGWLNVNIYDNFFPLVLLLITVGYGASCVAGQDEEGSLALVATLPVARRRITAEKSLALAIQALTTVVAVALAVIVGRAFGIDVSAGHLVELSLSVLLLSVALTIGAATGSRGTAIGATVVVASASYLVSSLAPVVSWIRPLRVASLFYWSVGNAQLTGGVGVAAFAVLVVTAVVLFAAAVVAFNRLDLH
jgi:ABC-2 type transport system permease protein